ncbi:MULTISPECIES: LuxR C-terminal-related transcriptional regulator [unclassified Paenibacillus]|uniref:LuxR C-terminal-related transcriptional regulator n=1 Tax=unclassified Paenibacillus TaxID=185978 RepID=UPI000C7B4522
MSIECISNHISNVMQKLNVKGLIEAARKSFSILHDEEWGKTFLFEVGKQKQANS